jgi:hypothetical protein
VSIYHEKNPTRIYISGNDKHDVLHLTVSAVRARSHGSGSTFARAHHMVEGSNWISDILTTSLGTQLRIETTSQTRVGARLVAWRTVPVGSRALQLFTWQSNLTPGRIVTQQELGELSLLRSRGRRGWADGRVMQRALTLRFRVVF